MKLKRPCPECGRLISVKACAWLSHALTHTGAPHPNTGNPHGPKSIGVPQVKNYRKRRKR